MEPLFGANIKGKPIYLYGVDIPNTNLLLIPLEIMANPSKYLKSPVLFLGLLENINLY